MSRIPKDSWSWFLLILAALLPLAILFLLPGNAFFAGFLFWIALLTALLLIRIFSRDSHSPPPADPPLPPHPPRMLVPEEQPTSVRQVMDVHLAVEQAGVQVFRGPLREPASQAYDTLKHAIPENTVPLIQQDDQLGASIVLMPKSTEQTALERPTRTWINWLLFILTFFTTTWAGAAYLGIDLTQEPSRFLSGLPYAIGLLSILGVHELGHYFTARHHGMNVTPPYFIPVPFALGTFGAFIQMRSPSENRTALFDVAVAGPLAGLVVAIPALVLGLQTSQVLPGDTAAHGTSVGSSILFALLSKISLGNALEYGHMVRLSPLAFAGWLGLFITALNLLPIGQLDGGHIARAMFGFRAGSVISTIVMWTLFLLAVFVWPSLLVWAIIVFFIAGRAAPPLNDLTPIPPWRQGLGYFAFVILFLILTPLPRSLWATLGIQSFNL